MAFPLNRPEARVHWERATEMFRALGETRLVAYGLAVTSATYIGDAEQHESAMRTNDEALALGRGAGSPALVAQVLNIRGELTRVAGRDELAREAYEEGLQISGDLGDEMYVSVFLSNLSYLADHRGDHDEARRLTHQALRICWSQGRRLMAAWTDLAAGRTGARDGPVRAGRRAHRRGRRGPARPRCPASPRRRARERPGGGRDPGEPGRPTVRGAARRRAPG